MIDVLRETVPSDGGGEKLNPPSTRKFADDNRTFGFPLTGFVLPG
jgi:hypothetical protein